MTRVRPGTTASTPRPRGFSASLLATLAAALSVMLMLIGPAAADDTANYQTVDGLGVYLGIVPAAIVKGHPKGHTEAEMHGGPPKGGHAYHIVIAIFEEQSGARVENARVSAMVAGAGHVGGTNFSLEPMSIADTITYGGFIDLLPTERYQIVVTIGIPGRPEPVRVTFAQEHVP